MGSQLHAQETVGGKTKSAPSESVKQIAFTPTPYLYDRRLLLHYSWAELDTIRTLDPQKFSSLQNYFLHSYKLDTSSCNGCSMSEFTQRFDISKYERYRKKHTAAVLYTKTGFKITVLPVSSLPFYLSIFQFAKNE